MDKNAVAAAPGKSKYDTMTGLNAYILGAASGLQYNQGGSNSCFNSVESSTTASSNTLYVL